MLEPNEIRPNAMIGIPKDRTAEIWRQRGHQHFKLYPVDPQGTGEKRRYFRHNAFYTSLIIFLLRKNFENNDVYTIYSKI